MYIRLSKFWAGPVHSSKSYNTRHTLTLPVLHASIPSPPSSIPARQRTSSLTPVLRSGSRKVELLEARVVFVEKEAAHAAALEEGTGAREASLKALQEKASPRHSVSIVAPVIAWVWHKHSISLKRLLLAPKTAGAHLLLPRGG